MLPSVPRASVVIPTHQRRDSVKRVLTALSRQTAGSETYEVLVAIDRSVDGTRELVAGFEAPYSLTALSSPNPGRAAACNAGVTVAAGEIVILLDDDMEPVPGFVDAHVRAHPPGTRLGVVGAAPIEVAPESNAVVRYIGQKFNRHMTLLATPDHAFELRDFYSGNFSIRRQVLSEAGMFDETFRLYGNEDLELSIRLRRAGVTLTFSAEAAALQSYTKSFRALARDNVEKGKTAVLLAEKHPTARSELKLATFDRGPFRRRAALRAALGITRAVPATADFVSSALEWLGARWPSATDHVYPHAVDYFYWVGVRQAEGERGNERFDAEPAAHPGPPQ